MALLLFSVTTFLNELGIDPITVVVFGAVAAVEQDEAQFLDAEDREIHQLLDADAGLARAFEEQVAVAGSPSPGTAGK